MLKQLMIAGLASFSLICADPCIIPIQDLLENDAAIFNCGECHDTIIEMTEGSYIPLGFAVSGDLLEMISESSSPAVIHCKRTVYMKFTDGELLFSSDLSEWKNFIESFTGTISAVVGHNDEGPMLTVGGELNAR